MNEVVIEKEEFREYGDNYSYIEIILSESSPWQFKITLNNYSHSIFTGYTKTGTNSFTFATLKAAKDKYDEWVDYGKGWLSQLIFCPKYRNITP